MGISGEQLILIYFNGIPSLSPSYRLLQEQPSGGTKTTFGALARPLEKPSKQRVAERAAEVHKRVSWVQEGSRPSGYNRPSSSKRAHPDRER